MPNRPDQHESDEHESDEQGLNGRGSAIPDRRFRARHAAEPSNSGADNIRSASPRIPTSNVTAPLFPLSPVPVPPASQPTTPLPEPSQRGASTQAGSTGDSALEARVKELESGIKRLLNKEGQDTNEAIVDGFRRISAAVGRWVGAFTASTAADVRKRYNRRVNESTDPQWLLDDLGLDFEASVAPARDEQASIRQAMAREWLLQLGRHDTCMAVVFTLAVWRELRALFSRPYPLGVSKQERRTFKRTEKSMRESAGYGEWSSPKFDIPCDSLLLTRSVKILKR